MSHKPEQHAELDSAESARRTATAQPGAAAPVRQAESLGGEGDDMRLAEYGETGGHGGIGARLAAARAARGLSLEACAAALKLPLRVLRKIEAEDYSGIDSRVYLASYLGSYARLLDIPLVDVERALDELAPEQPTLVATGTMPRGRYLVERYAAGATYAVLTALIAVPLLWLGLRGGLDTKLTHIAPLDMPAGRAPAPAAAPRPRTVAPPATPPRAPAAADGDKPLMASIAPFSAMETAPPAAAEAAPAKHSLRIHLDAESWVEVTRADGTRLEYGLLPAGSDREFHSDEPLEVRIGNADAASVEADGKPLDLAPYRHANVAHLQLFKTSAAAAADG